MSLLLDLSTSIVSVLLAFPALASTLERNVTIDDTNGDDSTGKKPTYAPDDSWGLTCPTCGPQFNVSLAHDKTWHYASSEPDSTSAPTVTLEFNGTAVYLYTVVINQNTNISLVLDGEAIASDQIPQFPSASTGGPWYNYPAFSVTNLSDSAHTLEIKVVLWQFLFDYAVYTTTVDEAGTPNSVTPGGLSSSSGESHRPPLAAIIGTLGGVLAALLVAVLVFFLHDRRAKRKRKRRKVPARSRMTLDEDPSDMREYQGTTGGESSSTVVNPNGSLVPNRARVVKFAVPSKHRLSASTPPMAVPSSPTRAASPQLAGQRSRLEDERPDATDQPTSPPLPTQTSVLNSQVAALQRQLMKLKETRRSWAARPALSTPMPSEERSPCEPNSLPVLETAGASGGTSDDRAVASTELSLAAGRPGDDRNALQSVASAQAATPSAPALQLQVEVLQGEVRRLQEELEQREREMQAIMDAPPEYSSEVG